MMNLHPTAAPPAPLAPSRSLAVFFGEEMVADSASFSPSAGKPAAVVASWRRRGLPIELRAPTPATIEELALAHDPAHVRAVLAGRSENGFGNRSAEVAASLPWTSGAMLSAARHAVLSRTIACAPCSGFHHAEHGSVGGFCTFNGLMVAACALRRDRLVERVGIVDCDVHYGNGTEQIVEHLGARSWVRHFTLGGAYHGRRDAERFLADLPAIVLGMRDCDLVLYQAGADPHVDDPLGGMLTKAQLRRRDALVFDGFARLGVPVAWNLAGGYQKEADGSIPKVLEIHDHTALEWARVLQVEVPCDAR